MEDWGELALLFLDQVDPSHVWGMDLDSIMEAVRAGGLTREEAGAVAQWLFVCLPPHTADNGRVVWGSPEDIFPETESSKERQQTIH